MTTIQRTDTERATGADRLLRLSASCFTVAVLFHNSDHVRRGAAAVPSEVFWAGTLSIALEVGIVVLIVMGHRLAPLAAAATGFSLAAGYVFVHALPQRSWLSDSLVSGGAETISQVAALTEIAAALFLGVAGTRTLRQRGGLASATVDRPTAPWSEVLTNPAVIAMSLGNVVILVLSLADRGM